MDKEQSWEERLMNAIWALPVPTSLDDVHKAMLPFICDLLREAIERAYGLAWVNSNESIDTHRLLQQQLKAEYLGEDGEVKDE